MTAYALKLAAARGQRALPHGLDVALEWLTRGVERGAIVPLCQSVCQVELDRITICAQIERMSCQQCVWYGGFKLSHVLALLLAQRYVPPPVRVELSPHGIINLAEAAEQRACRRLVAQLRRHL